MKQFFSKGIFGTGWLNALVSLGLAVGVYFSSQVYAQLNHGPAVLNLRTPLDAALPLTPVFVIPYVSLEPVIYFTLIVFLLCRTRLFQSACCALLIAWWVSYGYYFFLQTEVIRPALTGGGVLTRMIQDVYAGDNPFNDFPSLHTSLSVILAIHWFKVKRSIGLAAAAWTALIVASTVLIKQHYVADLVAGLLLAFGAAWVCQRLILPKD